MSIISFSLRRHLSRFQREQYTLPPVSQTEEIQLQPNTLTQMAQAEKGVLPELIQQSPIAMKYLDLLGEIAWQKLPRPHTRPMPGPRPCSPLPYIAAFLVKIDQKQTSMGQLRQYLVEHPALTLLLGFPLQATGAYPWGFDVHASLPTPSRFSRILRELPNNTLQFLLDETVRLLKVNLPEKGSFGTRVSLDTTHILAFVKENNPKVFIKEGRLDKSKQHVGDKDCRLGFKPDNNQNKTPRSEAQPGSNKGVAPGDYYWGYASGIVVTKIPSWGEFVVAELTRTFEKSDVSYFFPLMEQAERRLGFKPPYGTLDAAFDCWYVYEYFHHSGGFAAVPFSQTGKHPKRTFSEEGLPLCQANLAMPIKSTFFSRTDLVPHEKARHVCPLLFPQATGKTCPIQHKKWASGGCVSTMATSVGARLRYQLNRDSEAYRTLYKERTATERIFSRAKDFGIERPKLRNRQSITNHNTLIYVLLNLRSLQRVKLQRKAQSES